MSKTNWTYKPMGEVGTFLRGKSILKSDFVEQGMPCIHYGQVHTKFGVSVDRHLSEIPVELYNKSIIASPGDTIIAITSEDLEGSCKSTDWLGNSDVAVSAHAAVYKHDFVPKFLPYYLRSRSFYVEKEKYARGFKVMEIKPSDLAKIPVPVPSKETQLCIVKELDSLNISITMLQQQVEDLDKLAQSIFYDLFGDPILNDKGWNTKIISEIATVKTGPFGSMLHKEDYISGGIPLVNPIHMKGYRICPDVDFTVTNEKAKELSNYLLETGDIVLARRGDIGRCAVVNKKEDGYLCGTGSLFVRFSESTESKFIMYVVKAKSFTNALIKSAKGATMLNLNSTIVGNLRLILPPFSLQQSFASQITAIENLKTTLDAQIAELKYLLASRMQYWFD